MDPIVLQLLARIKIRLRQEKGISVNTQRFFNEPPYAEKVLDAAEDCEDIELVTSAMQLREQIGLISAASHASAIKQAAPAPAPVETSAKQSRYMFGARS